MSVARDVESVSSAPAVAALPPPSPVRGALRQIPFRVSAVIPLQGFKLRDLHTLRAGQVLTTEMSATDDVPVFIGAAPLAFAELDDVDGQMALRLTRLS